MFYAQAQLKIQILLELIFCQDFMTQPVRLKLAVSPLESFQGNKCFILPSLYSLHCKEVNWLR